MLPCENKGSTVCSQEWYEILLALKSKVQCKSAMTGSRSPFRFLMVAVHAPVDLLLPLDEGAMV